LEDADPALPHHIPAAVDRLTRSNRSLILQCLRERREDRRHGNLPAAAADESFDPARLCCPANVGVTDSIHTTSAAEITRLARRAAP
jgi:hypothetical protein